MRVRPYEKKDLKSMIQIWNEVVEEGVAFPQKELLDNKTGADFFASQTHAAVAEDENNHVICGLYILHPNNIGRCGHIGNASYAVRSEYRGRHIGEQLVLDSLRQAEKHAFTIMQFNAVVESNVQARHLYERLGFIPLGIIPKGFKMKDGHFENICPYYRELKAIRNESEIKLEIQDSEWAFEYVDHDRQIARAIVFDGSGYFYFVRVIRDDDFGKATLIETAGGGVESGEEFTAAVKRELKEELGAEVDILCKIGIVSDYYNLIHRHNINHYYLCKITSFGEKNLTKAEMESFHLSTLKLSYDEAVGEYEKCSATKLGRLVANRELPVLRRAKEIMVKWRYWC